jgi:RNA polymerase sigma-70 factor (ECF subfamily)
MKTVRFEEILRSENRKIFNYLLKMLRNREDAEDTTQEVFLAFYRKMETVDEKSYRSYLFKSAYNQALNKIRKNKSYNKVYNSTAAVENYPDKQPDSNDNFHKELVSNAFRKLKPQEAQLIEMQYYQKMSYQQIAEALGLSVSAVDSRLVRAKKKLKKFILQEKKSGIVTNK